MKCGMLINSLLWMKAGLLQNCQLIHLMIVHCSQTLFILIRLLHVLDSFAHKWSIIGSVLTMSFVVSSGVIVDYCDTDIKEDTTRHR